MKSPKLTEASWRKDPAFRALCASLLSCETEEDMATLLRDIGTLSELQSWGERLEVAKQLSRGLSYRQVAANTGASTTTVTRVAKFLQGGEGGYRRILKMMGETVPAEAEQDGTRRGGIQKAGELRSNLVQKYLQK